MKRVVVFVFLTFIFTMLCGCEPPFYWLEGEELAIEEIELIYYNNPESASIDPEKQKVIPFDFEKMQIIEVMDEESKSRFMDKLPSWDFWLGFGKSDSPNGYSLKFNCANGNFIIVSFDEADYAVLFDENGQVLKDYGAMVFDAHDANEYFDFQIPD